MIYINKTSEKKFWVKKLSKKRKKILELTENVMKQKLSVMLLIGGCFFTIISMKSGGFRAVFVIYSQIIRELFANYSWFVRDLFVRLNLRTRRTKREFREVCSPFSKITNVRSSFILLVRWTPYSCLKSLSKSNFCMSTPLYPLK